MSRTTGGDSAGVEDLGVSQDGFDTIMISKTIAAAFALLASGAATPVAMAQTGSTPQYKQLGTAQARGENPYYHVNRYGFGNYVQGPNGAYGGYPAGSAGAIELENEHRIKCRDVPETC